MTTALCGVAQQSAPDADRANVPNSTLHVYVNRMQVPVLLLDSYRHPTRPIPASQFVVNLDGVRPLRPSDVRLEGDDPIALTLFLDHSDPEEYLWDSVPKALPALIQSLRPQDRVEVYSLDGCRLRRFGPAAESDFTQIPAHVVQALFVKPQAAVEKSSGKCDGPVGLWDAMLYIAAKMPEHPGRHILLTLSNGRTSGDPATMERLRKILNLHSTAVFNIRHGEAGLGDRMLQVDAGRIINGSIGSTGSAPSTTAPEAIWSGYLLGVEAELSGGMVISSTTRGLPHTFTEVMERVRGRYILEFPRPEGLSAGAHGLSVSIGKSRYFIRPAGVSVPVSTEGDANTISLDHSVFPLEAAPSVKEAIPNR